MFPLASDPFKGDLVIILLDSPFEINAYVSTIQLAEAGYDPPGNIYRLFYQFSQLLWEFEVIKQMANQKLDCCGT